MKHLKLVFFCLIATVFIASFNACKKNDTSLEACFTAIADTVVTGQQISFNASCSSNATSYNWTFGDGNVASTAIVTKSYSTPGTYTITLTVGGVSGTMDKTKTIVVKAANIVFLGTYACTDVCPSGTYTYNMVITAAGGNAVNISNFAGTGDMVLATISGSSLTIASQSGGIYDFSGTGTLNADHIHLSIGYTISGGGTATETCSISAVKQ